MGKLGFLSWFAFASALFLSLFFSFVNSGKVTNYIVNV